MVPPTRADPTSGAGAGLRGKAAALGASLFSSALGTLTAGGGRPRFGGEGCELVVVAVVGGVTPSEAAEVAQLARQLPAMQKRGPAGGDGGVVVVSVGGLATPRTAAATVLHGLGTMAKV